MTMEAWTARALIYFRGLAVLALLFCSVCHAGSSLPGTPSPLNTRFVAIGFHDVTAPGEQEDVDSVSVDKLITFFDWLKADGWTVISPDDVRAASEGRKGLPAKAIVLGFDDGYVSFYTRVYPLLLAYRYPAMLSLVGQWMEQRPGTKVDYGGLPVPREAFLTWEQVRRMHASGLVEVASHSYDLHKVIKINWQGNELGAGRAWLYDAATGHTETDPEHRARIRADLLYSQQVIARETGSTPRVLVWPFGRFSGLAMDEARALGFDQIYMLTPGLADARDPLMIPRYYPTRDPDLGEVVDNLKFKPLAAPVVRAVCVDLAPLAEARDLEQQNAVLGRMIEDLRRLGPSIVIVEPVRYSADGTRPVASWTPTSLLPLEADILSRAGRQLGSRSGGVVYVRLRLPALLNAFGEQGVKELARQVARGAPIEGLALDGDGGSTEPNGVLSFAEIRWIRGSAPAESSLALRVMRAGMEVEPLLRLMIIANGNEPAGPPDGANMIVWPPAATAEEAKAQVARLKAAGWIKPGLAGRIVLGIPHLPAEQQAQTIRAMEMQGGNAVSLCPWVPGDSSILAPVFSSSNSPLRR
jgi:peptidoglycan/xylan/chitin deacetylase (PgdA/CDA1 family)